MPNEAIKFLRLIPQAYKKAYGSRERSFEYYGNGIDPEQSGIGDSGYVLEMADSSGGKACENCVTQEVGELIALLLNFAYLYTHHVK